MLREELDEFNRTLNRLIEETERDLKNAPEGQLRIDGSNRQFYHRLSPKDTIGEYIPKDKMELVKLLAQKNYDEKLHNVATKLSGKLKYIIDSNLYDELTQVYCKMNPIRQELIAPKIISDAEYAKKWQETSFQKGDFFDISQSNFITRKGEQVRSKSEIIIADTLYDMGIPYKYECPLLLRDGSVKYPDFTILVTATRKEKYLEHFGMMDDPKYVEGFLTKIEHYSKNGIVVGDTLLATFESSKHPLNVRELKRLLANI